ncbi:MAG: M48 family metalloprotease [Elusimicrobiota bacterium]
MKRLFMIALAPAAFLAAGCAELQKMDMNKLSGGRISNNVDLTKVAKGVKALRKGVEEISESEEYYIGRAVSAQILGRYKPLNDAKINLYVQTVAQVVARTSDRPEIFKGYHVQVLDSEEVNAFAAPGGFIFVTKGLLKRLKSEDELACVLAHEVAHIAQKHGLKTIQTSRLTSAFAILGSEVAKNYTPSQLTQLTTAFEGAVDDVVNKLVVNGYSRDKEYEADHSGALYAKNASYDPGAMRSFLERVAQVESSGMSLFKTHPPAGKRMAELRAVDPSASYRRSTERERRFSAAVAL